MFLIRTFNLKIICCLAFCWMPFWIFSQDTLNPCLRADSYHIVVLGSSTAAGSGPSSADSTWVNRFRKYLRTIHPENQVTNLAIGGTTTYHIMPDWFIPPPGRPIPNPSNNISQAVSLEADAIIVNMPSNDASNGFGVMEQLFNFHTMNAVADSAGIPVWFCTTQPKTPFGASRDSIQIGVRDSIFAAFGLFAIDFWTTIALPNNDIDPLYDSGDGTHLNDAAHGILFGRVRDENILSHIYDTLGVQDHAIIEYGIRNESLCGDSATLIEAVVTNLGIAGAEDLYFYHRVTDHSIPSTMLIVDTIRGGLSTCQTDTLFLFLNTASGVDWEVVGYLETAVDTNLRNDTTSIVNLITTGLPEIEVTNDTVCKNETALLFAHSTDYIFWYDSLEGGTIIGDSTVLLTENLLADETVYAEAVRGPLHFSKSLFTTDISSTNWNGIMFDIAAIDSITIDSLALKINSTGTQGVVAYYKPGPYLGSEMNAVDWILWGVDTLNVHFVGEMKTADFGPLGVNAGDTVGIYLHMQNGASRLSYQNVSNPITRSNDQLSITSGSGITYTFGIPYFPRDWNGEVFYHYGYNPQGQCVSRRWPVHGVVSDPQINLGNDTTILLSESLVLSPGSGFVSYSWSTGDTTAQLIVDSALFAPGTYTISVEAIDWFGCLAADTIVITLEEETTTGWVPIDRADVLISPNPNSGNFEINTSFELPDYIYLYNSQGQVVETLRGQPARYVLKRDLPSGMYILSIPFADQVLRLQMAVVK